MFKLANKDIYVPEIVKMYKFSLLGTKQLPTYTINFVCTR